MNQEQKKALVKTVEALRAAVTQLELVQSQWPSDLKDELDSIESDIENERDAEEEKFDNMPEGLQQGELGQSIEEAAQNLDTVKDRLSEATEAFGEAADKLSDAISNVSEAADELEAII
jgi:phage-related minor tail protein